HSLAMAAYEDQCAPANPRMPMIDDMKTLMEAAFYGTSFAEVRATRAAAVVAADALTVTTPDAPAAPAKKSTGKAKAAHGG
ncbi:MAG: bifunctional acetaldehyde-CoA/alcohol dehydrogenase, partial [Microbacterium sp.]|nr:bifunctional acetaldehyde-CoA/alcohol dehydrogenase [Microbacterium sp.]